MRINRASGLKRLAIVAAALGLLSLATPAAAQYLTFVSATGNDANNCLVQASPCKTLQKAINVTAARGEVRLLSRLISTGFITKSITIDGAGNTLVGAITINSATAVVTLRGLGLNGVGGYVNGIRIDSAATVHIEDCTVERYTGDGIQMVATTATKLFVSDTVSRDNGSSGLIVDDINALVAVEDSRFESNGVYGLYLRTSGANVTRSLASGSTSTTAGAGIYLSGGKTTITETTAVDNGNSGFWLVNGAVATLASSVARGNLFGFRLEGVVSATLIDCVVVDNSDKGILNYGTVTMTNSVVLTITNNGTIYTRQNNTVGGSTTGSAPLPYAAY